jgi:hypothetical protein
VLLALLLDQGIHLVLHALLDARSHLVKVSAVDYQLPSDGHVDVEGAVLGLEEDFNEFRLG